MPLPSIPINAIVSGYTENLNWLHEATSRQIVIFVEPEKTGCPNHIGYDIINKRAFPNYNSGNPYSSSTPTAIPSFGISGILNVPFSGGMVCPVCNGDGHIFFPSSGTAKARIQWRNEDTDFNVNGVKLKETNFDVRIKVTGSQAVDLLDRSVRVRVDNVDCVILKEKVPVGLRDIHTYYYYLMEQQ